MIIWCVELSTRLEKIGIENKMMPRFVDDITLCPKIIPPGCKYRNGALSLFKECLQEDEREKYDIRIM